MSAIAPANGDCPCQPDECLKGCASLCSILRLEAEQQLFQEGDVQKFVYKVKDGTIRVYKLFGSGQRRLMRLVGPGGFLGLGVTSRFPFSAQAVTTCQLCCISKEALQSRAVEYAPLTYQLYEAISFELEATQYFALMVSQRDPEQRLALFLTMLSRLNKQHGMDSEMISLPMARRDIADHLGLSAETVSRIFTRFKERGFIEIREARNIRIIDAGSLAAMAEFRH